MSNTTWEQDCWLEEFDSYDFADDWARDLSNTFGEPVEPEQVRKACISMLQDHDDEAPEDVLPLESSLQDLQLEQLFAAWLVVVGRPHESMLFSMRYLIAKLGGLTGGEE